MRALAGLVIAALTASTPPPSADRGSALRFAWPDRGTAFVEQTDERRVGDTLQSSVIAMRLTVVPDGSRGGLLLRFSDQRAISGGQVPTERADPASPGVHVAKVFERASPAFAVSASGEFVGCRDLDATLREVVQAAGFPAMPSGVDAFRGLLEDLAANDWNAWVAGWRGAPLAPGEWMSGEIDAWHHGAPVRVRVARRGLMSPGEPGRVRLQAVAEYPSDAVRHYLGGVLLDLAIGAKELGDDPAVNARFLDRAKFSPVTETVTVELEAATMRPIVLARLRTFSAVAGGHWADASERRVHRFRWVAAAGS